LQGGFAARIVGGAGGDFLGREGLAGVAPVVGGQAGAGEVGFDAAGAAAVAGGQGQVVALG
jgi:hypothetical protein